ncbi:unnamed protein product [Caenorhabditis nigoni]
MSNSVVQLRSRTMSQKTFRLQKSFLIALMNSTCVLNVGYFASLEFVSLVLHLNTIISTPIHFFGFYCIIWETPKAMKSAKLYLLNLHIWIVLADYSCNILTIPFLLIPQVAGYTLGVLIHRPYREALFNFFKKNVAVRSGEYSFKSFFRIKRDVSVVVVAN